MDSYQLEIVTPSGTVYSGSVESLQAPGSLGSFGVLARHAPMISGVATGRLAFREAGVGGTRVMACSGGFVEVLGDRVTVLAEAAEFGEEIDLQRAEAARDRARKRLSQERGGVDRARAETALARALARIRIAAGN